MSELKPCPFCGGEITTIETHPGRGEIYCGHCDLTLGGNEAMTPEELTEKWNARTRESKSRYQKLFGTPERAARTLARMDVDACNWCVNSSGNPKDCRPCPYEYDYYGCYLPDGFSLLEWLRGDA